MSNLNHAVFALFLAAILFAAPLSARAAAESSSDQAPPVAVKEAAPKKAKESAKEEKTTSDQAPETVTEEQPAGETAKTEATAADENTQPAAPRQIDPQQLRDIEGIGLYNRSSAMSMGDDFWNKTNRSDLVAMYREMPAVSQVPAVQRLIRQTLLTQADAKGIHNDIGITPGEDLLTVRLEKLLEAGLYSEARALYVSLKDDPYHDRLIRAGMLATLFSGEKGLVCIDSNTFKEGSAKKSFVQLISAYCEVSATAAPSQASLSILDDAGLQMLGRLARQKDLKISYNSEEFSKLSLIEQAVIVAEKRLDLSSLTPEKIKSVPPSHLPFLIDTRDSLDQAQLSLMARAIEWGYPYKDALKTVYMSALPPASGGSGKMKGDSTVEKIAIMYADATNAASDDEAWPVIVAALRDTKPYGPGTMVPFADAIADIAPPPGLSPATLVQIYDIFLVSDQRIPYSWASYKVDPNLQKAGDSASLQQMAASYFMAGSPQDKARKALEIKGLLDKSNAGTIFFLDNIIENVDNPNSNIHNAEKIYEKEFNLTFRQDYVMPSMRTWKRMLDAGESRDITETALLSTILLQDQSTKDIYPGLLSGVLNSLEYVGLTDISAELAVYASLRNIK